MNRKRILVAPLDWGLGHATRCIPVIRELQKQNAEVIIGSNGKPLKILQQEFPKLESCVIDGYGITYRRSGSFAMAIIPQIPKLINSGIAEHKKLNQLVKDLKLNGVISDNRFGLFNHDVFCVFMTHQVGIIMPPVFKWAEKFIYKLNYRIMNKYDCCWVPDYAGSENFSGILSHKYLLPPQTTFIGPLSRFKKLEGLEMKYDLLVILSGPEPQRTVLEEKLLQQLRDMNLQTLIVRGTPGNETELKPASHIRAVSHLNADELNKAMMQSKYVVSRSGYSTIMDLAATGKKAMLIPTPGQTEQEYLGDYFHTKNIFYAASQSSFSLKNALNEIENFSGLEMKVSSDSLTQAVKDFLKKC
ncbi:MAG: glycosyltransferase [Bacteroidota bacterium]